MQNKIIIITGGANGLGYELVKQSLKNNLFVCNIDKDIEKMKVLTDMSYNASIKIETKQEKIL